MFVNNETRSGLRMKETHPEIPDSRNTQSFYQERKLVNSRSNGSNIPRSVNPYASDDGIAQYRAQAVESLLPLCFTERSGRKQEINEFYDRRDRGG